MSTNQKIIYVCFISFLWLVMMAPLSNSFGPEDIVKIMNWDDGKDYKYKNLAIDIQFSEDDKSPIYTLNFIPTSNQVLFGLVDKYIYYSSYSNEINLGIDQEKPKTTAPIFYSYNRDGEDRGNLGYVTLYAKKKSLENVSTKEMVNLVFYGYTQTENVTSNTEYEVTYRRTSDFKSFERFLFPFIKSEINLNLLLPELTSFADIQIEKYNIPDWMVDYEYSAQKIYFDSRFNLPLKEDGDFIRYITYPVHNDFEKFSILSINVDVKLKNWILILTVFFYFLSSSLYFVWLKIHKSNLINYFGYQFFLFAGLHGAYAVFGISVFFFTLLDVLLLSINLGILIILIKKKEINTKPFEKLFKGKSANVSKK